MKERVQRYIKRRARYSEILKKQNKSINRISNLRLLDAVAAVLSFVFFYRSGSKNTAWLTLLLYSGIFVYLVIIHSREIRRQKYIDSLVEINNNSAMRFTDEWKSFHDTGEDFKDESHPFSGDLDIFGRASLFQWINTSKTRFGRRKLKEILSDSTQDIKGIEMRQEAVGELSGRLWWRQRFEAEGMKVSGKIFEEEELYKWAEEKSELYNSKPLGAGIILLPLITTTALIFSYGLDLIPTVSFKILGFLHLVILSIGFKRRNEALEMIYKYKENLRTYGNMLEQIEKTNFKSSYIRELQRKLLNVNNKTAFFEIRRLEKIVEAMLNRKNIMFIPLNIILLWDYQIMTRLERWKRNSGHIVRGVMDAIGEMEALSSLAVINHDHPDWTFPVFEEEPSVFKAEALGHPLITRNQVCNDLFLDKNTTILLITGSNMSGKTTFLRTAGINLVLAYAGAPVCAASMECSIMKVYTCMRVSDNLDKNLSSFYAELLRIGDIVRSSKEEVQVFFLLDEIFKGTNSNDRHTGAKAVIKKLQDRGAAGMVSTHDLELGELEEKSSGIKNYHFQEYYEGNEIHFDYKLREGVSTTRNALYLIKMAGIDT